ncbi:hypothetical protein SAMN05216353_102116 [Halobacillus alkaliphilus]|uniref:Uncharacterized protein n=1 Tax=Halobacillus alkaliphilus TaxID=396056 RepID=A0A1I2JSB7_9BACI|nr:hypothetical protein [Halobacillus alkaliphilus]SFF57785.1 hypothetical protein SAMN05216353_102116 [Halobacillus alkaliphilus]
MKSTEDDNKRSSFQGSNREFFYVGYLIFISFLSVQFPLNGKYLLIPLVIVLGFDFYFNHNQFKTLKISVVIFFILLFVFT